MMLRCLLSKENEVPKTHIPTFIVNREKPKSKMAGNLSYHMITLF